MNAAPAAQREVVADVVRRFGLTSLEPTLRACEALAGDDAPLDVAVLGQFKSGKSSLLNAVLGEAVFPVGALPVTAVVTRAAAGPERVVRVTRLDGSVEEVAPARLADFVTEAGNPGNRRQVARVDVLTPALADLPGVRLVDTPGLGSVFTHNTEATRALDAERGGGAGHGQRRAAAVGRGPAAGGRGPADRPASRRGADQGGPARRTPSARK